VFFVGFAAIATFCGNAKQILEAVGTLRDRAFAQPSIELLAVEEPNNAVDREKKIIEIECRNLASAPCRLTLDPVALKPQDSSRVLYNSKIRLPEIGVGESKKFSIILMPNGLGAHELTITGTELAGIFHGNVSITPKVVPVTVWQDIDTHPTVKLQRALGEMAEISVTFKHGKPPTAGIQYGATLDPAADVSLVEVSQYTFDSDSNGRASAISWQDSKFQPFKPKDYVLFLKGAKSRNETEWNNVVSKIEISVGANG
jgi:hypothetical protein